MTADGLDALSRRSGQTANLQASKLTVAQCARIMNVSERSVYMARELLRTGREDLAREVEAGRLTILAALRIVKPEKYGRKPEPLKRLISAWARCSADDRARFLKIIGETSDRADNSQETL